MFEPDIEFRAKNSLAAFHDNRRALRASTQKMHSISELHWAGIFQTGKDITKFLTAMEMLHSHLGVPAASLCGMEGAADVEETRLAALRKDLGATHGTSAAPAITTTLGRDAAWGVLYALNGSALGATSLLRPGAALADQPSAYLNLMRDYARSGALAGFFRALNVEPLDVMQAARGADAVFAMMSHHDLGTKD